MQLPKYQEHVQKIFTSFHVLFIFIHSDSFSFFEFQIVCIHQWKQTIKTKYESTSIINIPTETLLLFRHFSTVNHVEWAKKILRANSHSFYFIPFPVRFLCPLIILFHSFKLPLSAELNVVENKTEWALPFPLAQLIWVMRWESFSSFFCFCCWYFLVLYACSVLLHSPGSFL